VDGTWKINLKPENDIILDGFIVDVTQSWSGSTHWTDKNKITGETTVTFPSTSDSILAIGAYVVNSLGRKMKKSECSAITAGIGYNIDGKMGDRYLRSRTLYFHIGTRKHLRDFQWKRVSAAPHVVALSHVITVITLLLHMHR